MANWPYRFLNKLMSPLGKSDDEPQYSQNCLTSSVISEQSHIDLTNDTTSVHFIKRFIEITDKDMARFNGMWPIRNIMCSEIAGAFAKTSSGKPRFDNFRTIQEKDNLRLFRDTTNEHDQNAIAVFPNKTHLTEEDLLGYVPRLENIHVLQALKDGLHICCIMYYLNEWYKLSDHHEEFPQYNNLIKILGFPRSDAPARDILFSKALIIGKTVDALERSGFISSADFELATDDELLGVPGVGPKTLKKIRNIYPYKSSP